MAVGRKPKPTHLKLVQGTMRKSRRNNREPKPAPGLPTARNTYRRLPGPSGVVSLPCSPRLGC